MRRKPKLKNSIISILIGISYPAVKYFTSNTNKMLVFLDSLTIIGLLYLLGGIIVSIAFHGDLDALVFRAKHPKISDNSSFETYKLNKKKERENSFNYPLFEGILFIVSAYLLATFCY